MTLPRLLRKGKLTPDGELEVFDSQSQTTFARAGFLNIPTSLPLGDISSTPADHSRESRTVPHAETAEEPER
jgi:hypothetical protein